MEGEVSVVPNSILIYFRLNVVPVLAAVWALFVVWKTLGRNNTHAATKITADGKNSATTTSTSNQQPAAYSLPPGPPKWPLLGNLPGMVMAGSSSKYLQTMIQQYGPIFTLFMGSRPVVVLNTYDVIKSALLDGNLLSDRCPVPAIDSYWQERGVVGARFHTTWRKSRSFAVNCLRVMGVTRGSFEGVVATQADALIEYIKTKRGDDACDPLVTLQASVCNVICGVVYGKQFEYDNPRFLHLLHTLHQSLREIQYAATSSLVPGMHYLPGNNFTKFYASMDTLRAFSREEIEEHDETLDVDHPRDIIDLYLIELRRLAPDDADLELFNKTNIEFVLLDLFTAGTESSATLLYWAILLVTSHPHIQDRLRKEIDGVTGQAGHVTMADGARLPYTKAVIEEALRYASVAIASMRCTTSDMVIDGHRLERDTWIMLNYEYASFDPETWSEPETFRPERFLDEDGEFAPKPQILSFGLGKRNCLGEKLARMEIFLFFTNIMKNFELVFPESSPSPSMEPQSGGITRMPPNYQVCFKNRTPSALINEE